MVKKTVGDEIFPERNEREGRNANGREETRMGANGVPVRSLRTGLQSHDVNFDIIVCRN